jgi:hypothetical protein
MSDVTIPEAVQAQAEAISQELVDHAFKHGKLVNAYLPEFIARAILAERERCAKIAEDLAANRKRLEQQRGFGPKTATAGANSYWCEEIAQAIRSSHE